MKKKKVLSCLVALLLLVTVLQPLPTQAASDLEGFVTRLYSLTLEREPDSGGLNYWVGELKAGRKTGAEVSQNFIFSKEFVQKDIPDSEFLDIMYRAFFNREPDEGGKNYWLGKINEGYNRKYILANFVNSKEFNEICSTYGIIPGNIKLGEADKKPSQPMEKLEVHFIDVGQGDSILIKTPKGQNMLIDAGSNDKGDVVKDYLIKQGVERVDVLVGTHPHEDHIGGLDVVIDNFDIGLICMPKVVHTTKTYEDVLLAAQRKGLKIQSAKAGMSLPIDGVNAQILAPEEDLVSDNLNDYSIVIKLEYKNTSFLFQGDAEEMTESTILDSGAIVEADVIKVGHHGSLSSSSIQYIEAVNPSYAIIMVGKDNSYGHPSQEVLDRLSEAGSAIYRTDISGTIIAESDGNMISIDAVPYESDTKEPKTDTADVQIASVDLDKEIVTIKNFSDTDIDMTGWKLVSVEGNQTFDFPNGYILKAGATITIASGRSTGDLKWTGSYIWNNDGDRAELYDSQGKLVSAK